MQEYMPIIISVISLFSAVICALIVRSKTSTVNREQSIKNAQNILDRVFNKPELNQLNDGKLSRRAKAYSTCESAMEKIDTFNKTIEVSGKQSELYDLKKAANDCQVTFTELQSLYDENNNLIESTKRQENNKLFLFVDSFNRFLSKYQKAMKYYVYQVDSRRRPHKLQNWIFIVAGIIVTFFGIELSINPFRFPEFSQAFQLNNIGSTLGIFAGALMFYAGFIGIVDRQLFD